MTNLRDASQANAVPVSRIQRFLPFFSYSLMALGGAAAGYYAMKVAIAFADLDNHGIGEISRALASGISAVTLGLILAMIVGFVAVILQAVMIFAQKKTTSPSLLPVLLMAILGAAAPALAWPIVMDLITAPLDPKMDPVQLKSSTMTYAAAAIALGLLTPIVGLVLTFLPLRSTSGKKFGALIVMILVEILMLGAFFYLTREAHGIMRIMMG